MPISDEELQKQQDRVARLREQVADATTTRENRERDLTNEITYNQLEIEASRLEAELAAAKESAKVATVKEASGLSTIKEQVKAAAAGEPIPTSVPVVVDDSVKNKE